MKETEIENIFRLQLEALHGECFVGPPTKKQWLSLSWSMGAAKTFFGTGELAFILERAQSEAKSKAELNQIVHAIFLPLFGPHYDDTAYLLSKLQGDALAVFADSANRILTLLDGTQHPTPDLPLNISQLATQTKLCSLLQQLRAYSTACAWPNLTPDCKAEAFKIEETVYAVEPLNRKHDNCRIWAVDGKKYAEQWELYRRPDWEHKQLIRTQIGEKTYRLYILSKGESPPVFQPPETSPDFDIQPLKIKNKRKEEWIYIDSVVQRLSKTSFMLTTSEASEILRVLFGKWADPIEIERILLPATTK